MDNKIILINDLALVRYHADRKRVNWTYRTTVTMLEHLVNVSRYDMQLFCDFYEKLIDTLNYTGMYTKCAEYWRAGHVN